MQHIMMQCLPNDFFLEILSLKKEDARESKFPGYNYEKVIL